MYYKVLNKNNKVIDVLSNLTYVRYSEKSNRLLISPQGQAFGVLSSSQDKAWHIRGFVKPNGYPCDTIDLVQISEEEYKQLKIFNGKTPEEVIDAYTLSLIEEGLI